MTDMKKTILFCDNTLWGLVNFRGNVIKHFLAKGFNVVLVAPEKDDSQMRTSVPSGIKYVPIEMGRTTTNPFSDIKYFASLLRIYHKERPDYIFNYTIKPNIYGSIAASLLNIRSCATMAGMGYIFLNDNIPAMIGRLLYRFGLRFPNHLFVLNEGNLEKILQQKLCSPKKIILLNGGEGVDLEKFAFCDNESDKLTFLFIGRLLLDKGYHEFVETARKVKEMHPSVKFQLVGPMDPSYPNSVSEADFDRDVNSGCVEYLGFMSDMDSIYRRKGIVVTLPSYSEGMNRALMEACASGKPIITTRIHGCSEAVDDGINGFLAEPRSTSSLIEAVLKYINLPKEERRNYSMASRKKAETLFDVNNVIKKYDKLLSM